MSTFQSIFNILTTTLTSWCKFNWFASAGLSNRQPRRSGRIVTVKANARQNVVLSEPRHRPWLTCCARFDGYCITITGLGLLVPALWTIVNITILWWAVPLFAYGILTTKLEIIRIKIRWKQKSEKRWAYGKPICPENMDCICCGSCCCIFTLF